MINTGTIDGGGTAERIVKGGLVIGGYAAGVALAAGGSVTNGGPVAGAALIEGGIGVDAAGAADATIINYGTVRGIGFFFRGIGLRLTSGFVNNAAGALINADNEAVSLGGATGSAIVSNSGTIHGVAGISIDHTATNSVTIVNYGTIAGAGGTAISLGALGNDLIVIGSNSSLQGFVSNLEPGDAFDLPFLPFDSGGTATVVSNGTLSQQLQIVEAAGTFAIDLDPEQKHGIFQLGTDAGGGTLVTEQVCFCRGTLILTETGEVPVEKLAVGDRVRTLSGAVRPIVWIGFGRDLVTCRHTLARPVIVRAGALADGVPRRDLHLTHGHALYLCGVLIPVENLINHRSILWDDAARVVEYYHIELADHDVVFADGAPAETYYDAANRALFQNRREGSEAGGKKPTCAPVLNSGETVERVWAALLERAGGHLEGVTTGDPDLHLLVDGARLDPTTIDDFAYTFALERTSRATLHLRSRSGVMSLVGIDRSDHRRLGVPITRIVLHHAGIATYFEHDAPQLREGGCHAAEDGYCWTDGEFTLPARFFRGLAGPVELTVQTRRHYMRYPLPAARIAAA